MRREKELGVDNRSRNISFEQQLQVNQVHSLGLHVFDNDIMEVSSLCARVSGDSQYNVDQTGEGYTL